MEMIPVETVMVLGLLMARTSTLVIMSPILGLRTGFSGHKIAIIFVLTAVLFVAVDPPEQGRPEPMLYGLLMLREVMVGAFLAFFLQLILLSVRVGGEMISQAMGLMTARLQDPTTGVQSTLVSSLYENYFLLSLLVMNAHLWLIRGLHESFTRAPVGKLEFSSNMWATMQAMFTDMFAAGIVFGAPVLILLAVVSMVLGLLARAVPTLNVMEIGFSLRVSGSLVAMYFFTPLIEPAMLRLNGTFLEWLDRGLDALG
jgi:flagellar biosynthetic protein FliR